jgi:hypothetical protein
VTEQEIVFKPESALRLWQSRSLPRRLVHGCRVVAAQGHEAKSGLPELEPLRTVLLCFLFGGWLVLWLTDRRQKLILVGGQGEAVGEIDLYGSDARSVRRLVVVLNSQESQEAHRGRRARSPGHG